MTPIVIVGAGAAGLMAAIFARGSRPVVLLESTSDGGRKILISGGGRCNVLPQALEPERFVTASSPALLRRMLRSWPIDEQRAFFERDVGVPLKLEAESRKWFPVSNRARDVRDGLLALARARGVECRFGVAVEGIAPLSSGWRIDTSAGAVDAAAVVLATGGRSVPATGSTGAGLAFAQQLGHTMHDTYAALTPLVASPARHAGLSGISFDVRLRARWRDRVIESTGGFLFTHRGYSGPSVLDVSHTAVRSANGTAERAVIRVQWCQVTADEWRQRLSSSNGTVLGVVTRELPQRVAEQLLSDAGVPRDRRLAELRRSERAAMVEHLTAYELPWTGDEGYKKAEVTGGGVALENVDPRTMESRRHPGLFMCGELLDAFGPIGGHNFAWAWSTGRLAGLGARAIPEL